MESAQRRGRGILLDFGLTTEMLLAGFWRIPGTAGSKGGILLQIQQYALSRARLFRPKSFPPRGKKGKNVLAVRMANKSPNIQRGKGVLTRWFFIVPAECISVDPMVLRLR